MQKFFVIVAGFLMSLATNAQPAVLVAHYPFTGDVSTVGTWNNLVLASAGPMYAGPGLTAVGYVNGQFVFPDRAKWATNWTVNGFALDLNDHFGCQLVPQAGYVLIIDSVTFKIRRSGTAPDTIEFRMGTTPVFLPFWKARTGPADAWRTFSITSGFIPAASAVDLRIYGRNATGTGGAMRLDDFKVYAHLENIFNLPIELLSFTGHAEDEVVELNWSTATETNNDYFTTYRLENDTTWRELGRVTGAGNSQSIQMYTMIDRNPEVGTNYYKLRQTDIDGAYEEFDIVAVEWKPPDKPTAYPNPSVAGTPVYLQQEVASVMVSDAAGRIIPSELRGPAVHFDGPPGKYFLLIVPLYGERQTIEIVTE